MADDSIYRAVRGGRVPKDIPVIDTHCHYGKFSNYYIPDNNAEAMIGAMDLLGIRQAWLSSIVAIFNDVRGGNEEVARALRDHPDRFLGVTVVNPNFPQQLKDELERCYDEFKFRAIKLHCPAHRYSVGGAAYEPVWRFASEKKVSVLAHTLEDDMPHVERIGREYPDLVLVIAHANQLQFEPCFQVVGALPNVYADIVSSGFPYGLIERLVKAVGSEKVLFGTDVPYLDPMSQWGKLAFARLDDRAKENIYFRNAEKIRSRIQDL